MKNILFNCFYDGMTLSEAIDFITRCYGEAPSARVIANAQKTIISTTGKKWK